MKFSIKEFFSKCDQIRRKLRIWSHLLKKSLMGNFIFCAVHFPEGKVLSYWSSHWQVLLEAPFLRILKSSEKNFTFYRGSQNPFKHIRWNFCENSERLKPVNYFRRKVHLGCLCGFWIRLYSTFDVDTNWTPLFSL